MNSLKFFGFCILTTLLPICASSQFYVSGQEPSATKWREYQSERFRTICPAKNDSICLLYARHIGSALASVGYGLNHVPKKFPVILRTMDAIPNGFVSWAPRRAEVVTTCPLDADPEPWVSSVSNHELRHIIQIDKLNTGPSRLAYWVLGESGTGLVAGLVPGWFLEGDAVFTETLLGIGGRGRSAEFLEPYRTHVLSFEKSHFSYDKWLLGSYRDYIPNHYAFGYLLVGHVNQQFGAETWGKTLSYLTRNPYTFFPFYFGLKKETYLSRKGLFLAALDSAATFWRQHSGGILLGETTVSAPNKDYAWYKYPLRVNDTTFIALKHTLNRPPVFVQINSISKTECSLFEPGYVTSRPFYSNGAIFWSEYRSHYRFSSISYSEIKVFNVKQKKTETLIKKDRLYNPVVLGNGNIAAIGTSDTGGSVVVISDSLGKKLFQIQCDGKEIREIHPLEKEILLIRAVSQLGNTVIKYNINTSVSETIFGPLQWDISNLSYSFPWIYFSASIDGVELIIGYNLLNNRYYKVFNSCFGLSQPVVNEKLMLATENSIKGNSIVLVPNDSLTHSQIIPGLGNYLYKKTLHASHEPLQNKPNDTLRYTLEPYRKIKNFFKFHSWAPFHYDPSDLSNGEAHITPGVTLLSQNLTSTAISTLRYSYLETHGYHASLSWLGWLPVLNLSFDHGKYFQRAYGNNAGSGAAHLLDAPMVAGRVNAFIPLRLTSGKYITQFSPGVQYSLTNNKLWKDDGYLEGLDILNLYGSIYRVKRMSVRDIRPHSGFSSYCSYTMSSLHGDVLGGSLYFRSSAYLPGVLRNHSLMLTGRLEKIVNRKYNYAPRAIAPRGYDALPDFKKVLSISIDYAFPVIYPDLKAGALIYLKRIYSNLFADNAFIAQKDGSGWLNTAGIDIVNNLHFFRTRYPIAIGYRIGYAFERKGAFNAILLNVDLNSLTGSNPFHNLFEINF